MNVLVSKSSKQNILRSIQTLCYSIWTIVLGYMNLTEVVKIIKLNFHFYSSGKILKSIVTNLIEVKSGVYH